MSSENLQGFLQLDIIALAFSLIGALAEVVISKTGLSIKSLLTALGISLLDALIIKIILG